MGKYFFSNSALLNIHYLCNILVGVENFIQLWHLIRLMKIYEQHLGIIFYRCSDNHANVNVLSDMTEKSP